MPLPSQRTWRHAGALLAAVAIASLAVRCSSTTIDPDAHAWGSFASCLRRVSDECRASGADGGCRTEAVSAKSLVLAARPDGTFLWGGDGLSTLEGRQAGDRFEVVRRATKVATICGCEADVTETIRGELSEGRGPAIACEQANPAAGCGTPVPATLFDGGMPGTDWVSGLDAGIDPGRNYASFRALVVDEAVNAGGEGCSCLPCRVVFEVAGGR